MALMRSQAAVITPPGAPVVNAITAGVPSTAAANLSAANGRWIVISSTEPVHLFFGPSDVGAATANHLRLPGDTPVSYYLPMDGSRSYLRALRAGSTDAVITIADASDPA